MAKHIFITSFFALIFCSINLSGQTISLSVEKTPLNKVFTELIDDYNVSISFDDRALSKYKVSANKTFDNTEQAVSYLIQGLPIQYEESGGVIIVFVVDKEVLKKEWTISGRILETGSGEPLPYSNIIINDNGTVSDMMGNFSFTSKTDSIFSLRVSYLGYFVKDTLLLSSKNNRIYLNPTSIGLTEVEIKNQIIDNSGQYGMKAGMIKLNQRVANFLPGYGDNAIFNLLRLQAGILASGEQTNGLIIWGSYEGQSKMMFDGFTIYGLKNFNDNISSFNPLMAKDVEVYKGGYEASMGERVGGIVKVNGKMGSLDKTRFEFTANNMTLNAIVEIPILKKSSLVFAFRNTYYELYDQNDFSSLLRRNTDNNTDNDVTVNPDYKFRDMNVKYSTRLGKNEDLFYVSFYGAVDKFSYNIDEILPKVNFVKETSENNTQSGASAFYGKQWNAKSRSNFTFSYSSIRSQFFDYMKTIPANIANIKIREDKQTDNRLNESSLKVDNFFNINKYHNLEAGAEILSNRMILIEDTFNINYLNMEKRSPRLNIYVQDNISISKKISVKPGIRATHSTLLKDIYLDPRISLKYQANDKLRFNLAWGIYHQFVSHTSVVDQTGNYRYLWTVSDNDGVPVLNSQHFVVGSNFNKGGFTANIDAYYKYTKGLTRFIRSQLYNIEDVYTGVSRSYGIDFLIKQDVGKHSFWVSYSLSKTEELFTYFLIQLYRLAPQDQRHEIKVAGLLNFDPFFISGDYVYGSGFPDYIYEIQPNSVAEQTYSRLDLSIIYKFLNRKLKGEVGLSILNVLNHSNFKLSNFERIPTDQTNTVNVYAEAIPFTPTLYLKIYL
ncbi:MAG: TonB-dependent receptor [Marinilabiliales bacterium]|nr:MAG: TonB-dependent receptor [Marinilabiliales bacterium]